MDIGPWRRLEPIRRAPLPPFEYEVPPAGVRPQLLERSFCPAMSCWSLQRSQTTTRQHRYRTGETSGRQVDGAAAAATLLLLLLVFLLLALALALALAACGALTLRRRLTHGTQVGEQGGSPFAAGVAAARARFPPTAPRPAIRSYSYLPSRSRQQRQATWTRRRVPAE